MDRVITTGYNSYLYNNHNDIPHTEAGWFQDLTYNIHRNVFHPESTLISKDWICLFVDSQKNDILMYRTYLPEYSGPRFRQYYDLPEVNGPHDDVMEKLKDCLTKLSEHGIGANNHVKIWKNRLHIGERDNVSLVVIHVDHLDNKKLWDIAVKRALTTFFGTASRNYDMIEYDKLVEKQIHFYMDETVIGIETYLKHNHDKNQWIDWPLNWVHLGSKYSHVRTNVAKNGHGGLLLHGPDSTDVAENGHHGVSLHNSSSFVGAPGHGGPSLHGPVVAKNGPEGVWRWPWS
jgi:hypothetical protein